jgi:hypothetical protein
VNKEHARTFRRNENRKDPICFSLYLYGARNLVERFFNKIKQCRRIATDTTNYRQTIWHSSSLHRSEFGCVLMSPRLSQPACQSTGCAISCASDATLPAGAEKPSHRPSGRATNLVPC